MVSSHRTQDLTLIRTTPVTFTSTFDLRPDVTSHEHHSGESSNVADHSLVALRIETKYEFRDRGGEAYHDYVIPSDRDIQNCGGYVDKLLRYRDPRLAEYVLGRQPDLDYLRSSPFPVLTGRSPHIDVILSEIILGLRGQDGARRVSLLDHGCTVAEHFDLLDLLFRASGGEPADQLLSYTGLDVSPLALCAARLFHLPLLGEHFRLVLSEGSDLDLLPDNSSDCSISVGVVNHVARPLEALEHLIRITREAVVMALWATGEDEGFWAFNHSGYSNYFFSTADLRRLANKYSKGRFYVAEYVPELASSQPGSYIGVSPDRLEKMGSYILIYSRLERLPAHLARIDF